MTSRHLLIAVVVASLAGFVFSAFSTSDFIEHYDRQVHGVHCSFLPGLASEDATGTSGCQVTMLSPYSSVLRSVLWGGIPITLPSASVFAFLIFVAVEILAGRREGDRTSTRNLVLATCIPLAATLVMGGIAVVLVEAACKMCIGIYVSSVVSFGAAFVAWRRAVSERWTAGTGTGDGGDAAGDTEPDLAVLPARRGGGPALGVLAAIAVLFVAAPVAALVVTAPDHEPYIMSCGMLRDPSDRYGVMVPLPLSEGASVKASAAASAAAIEVLDPLCPACRAFEQSLDRFSRKAELDRKAVLFPLDNECNWMVDSAIHPGACTVSEAVLCANEKAPEVLAWAFAQQEAIREAAAADPAVAKTLVLEAFPGLSKCIGSAGVRSRLNKSLRWAVTNRLRVLTPQVFIEGVRLCEEDLDLGQEYALGAILDAHAAGTLPKPKPLPKPEPASAPVAAASPTAGMDGAAAEPGGEAAAADAGDGAAGDAGGAKDGATAEPGDALAPGAEVPGAEANGGAGEDAPGGHDPAEQPVDGGKAVDAPRAEPATDVGAADGEEVSP